MLQILHCMSLWGEFCHCAPTIPQWCASLKVFISWLYCLPVLNMLWNNWCEIFHACLLAGQQNQNDGKINWQIKFSLDFAWVGLFRSTAGVQISLTSNSNKNGVEMHFEHVFFFFFIFRDTTFNLVPTIILGLTLVLVEVLIRFSLSLSLFSEKSAFEYGLVNHALCAAMRSLIKVMCVACVCLYSCVWVRCWCLRT